VITKDLPYKATDLQGVTMLAYSPHMLVATPALPANTLQELVALSKRRKINVASSGTGAPTHLAMAEIAMATGMQWQHVPYRGGAQSIADTAAGVTDVVMNGMLATLPLVQAGRLKVIGISKRTRMALVGNMPTIAEQGMPSFESGTYQGVAVASTTPKAIVDKLNAALISVIRSPDVRARLLQAGAEVTTSTPQDTNQFLISERKRWSGVIERAGENIEGTTP
jgi:tripartite-type tricarboxylate transporter receptor subunit TctC